MADAKPSTRRNALIAAAIALAAPAEGLRQWAYRDPPGILTVCYGHTGADVDATRQYSLGECQALLGEDMARAVDHVQRCAPGAPDSVVVAFSDAAFNLGASIACDRNTSTAARLLAAQRWREACEQLPRWDKAKVGGQLVALPGLTRRRAAERDVCVAGLS